LQVVSRDHRPLHRYFPELPGPLAAALPERCVVDGEIVVAGAEGLHFDGLLQRIHPARSRIELLAQQTPATYVAFDLLALGDRDLTGSPLHERRSALEGLLGPAASPDEPARPGTQVLLTPQTPDPEEAKLWMSSLEGIGLDGAVAKRRDGPYVFGERVMVKVKLQRTADCVVGGYRLSKAGDGVGSLLLGLYDDGGTLQYVGHTSSFKAGERRSLLAELRPLETAESFGSGRAPGAPSRWTRQRDVSWVPLEPRLVCEVAFDRFMGERFRHATRFLRWRPDRDPRSCTLDQLGG
jgi:ATP-dependent DNA ligase